MNIESLSPEEKHLAYQLGVELDDAFAGLVRDREVVVGDLVYLRAVLILASRQAAAAIAGLPREDQDLLVSQCVPIFAGLTQEYLQAYHENP
jgi:hypothetical protein